VKRLTFLIVVLVILGAGGMLTAQLLSGNSSLLPIVEQTTNPAGDVNQVLPWKAEQFLLLVGFLLFNMIGIGLTIALIMWFLDRGVRSVRTEQAAKGTKAPAATGKAVEEA
jgi:pheromone shutdown protein TraB